MATQTRLNRRAMLATLAGSGAMLAASRPDRIKIGCQTNAWPVNPAQFDTLLSTLAEIKRLGFAGYETGFRNVEPRFDRIKETRAELAAAGLTCFGVHIFLPKYEQQSHIAPLELAHRIANGAAALGAERLILSGAPATLNDRFDPAVLQRKAEALNTIGRHTRQFNIGLAYHNHGPEFSHDAQEINALITATDPALVSFVVDAGHAHRAGADLPDFVRRHGPRLAGLHLRDMNNGKEVPLGQGTFPLAAVAQALKETNWRGWVLAEEERADGSKPGTSAAEPAYASLRKAFPQ